MTTQKLRTSEAYRNGSPAVPVSCVHGKKRKVSHKHVASLEALPPKWATIGGDGGKWIHPNTGEHVELLLKDGVSTLGTHKTCVWIQLVLSVAMK